MFVSALLHLLSVHAKSLQFCLTVCDPMDGSLPGFSVHGILQIRMPEWVAVPSSRGSSWSRDWTLSLLHWQEGSLSPVFPGSVSKGSACNGGDLGLIPGSWRSPGEGNGNSLQYSCLENSTDRGAWWITVHGVTKSWIRLSNSTYTHLQAANSTPGGFPCIHTMANVPFFCACSSFPAPYNNYLHSVL